MERLCPKGPVLTWTFFSQRQCWRLVLPCNQPGIFSCSRNNSTCVLVLSSTSCQVYFLAYLRMVSSSCLVRGALSTRTRHHCPSFPGRSLFLSANYRQIHNQETPSCYVCCRDKNRDVKSKVCFYPDLVIAGSSPDIFVLDGTL